MEVALVKIREKQAFCILFFFIVYIYLPIYIYHRRRCRCYIVAFHVMAALHCV